MFSLIICMLIAVNIQHTLSHPECIRVNNPSHKNEFIGVYKYYGIENGYPVYQQIQPVAHQIRKISVKLDEYTFTFSGENEGPQCLDGSIPESPIKCLEWTHNFVISESKCDDSKTPIQILTKNTHSDIKRRLNIVTGNLCVWGTTVDPIYWPKSSDSFKRYIYIQGDYSYGGVDDNGNDFWEMAYDGNNCWNKPYNPDPFPIYSLFIRKSTNHNRYEISTRNIEGYSITICNDNINSPYECTSWSSENLGDVNSDNPVRIMKDKCIDVQTEKKLIVSDYPHCKPGDENYYCNGEFTKDDNLVNVYNGEKNFWFFSYPNQHWMCMGNYCKNGECLYDDKSSDVRKMCYYTNEVTRYDGSKMVFE